MSDSNDCDCELDYPEPTGEESWHYRRVCTLCGTEWGALHCPHDGAQNPCPACGWIAPGKRTPLQILGVTEAPGLAEIQARVGHESIETTIEVYRKMINDVSDDDPER